MSETSPRPAPNWRPDPPMPPSGGSGPGERLPSSDLHLCRISTQLITIAGVAAVYFFVGRLAQLLAIPPGVVAPIWPSAGIALVAVLRFGPRILPGIFLGAFLVNAGSIDFSRPAELFPALAVCTALGTGATLRAFIGRALIRRYVHSLSLNSIRDVARFFILGGPVACTASATIGIATLWATGVVPGSDLTFCWFTFWVGDAIGVIGAAPLAMVFFGLPRDVWSKRQTRVAVPLAITVCFSITAFAYTRSWEQTTITQNFEDECENTLWAIEMDSQSYLDTLISIERYFANSEFVSDREFRSFVADCLSRNEGIHALEWIPRIAAAQRSAYEAGVVWPNQGAEIRERDLDGSLRRASPREEHFPVTYVEPIVGNEQALGFDLASNEEGRAAIERARDSGIATGTPPITLIQQSTSRTGFLVVYPVYYEATSPTTVDERRSRFLGVACGVFLVEDFAGAALSGIAKKAVHLQIFDARTDDPILSYGSDLSPELLREQPLHLLHVVNCLGRPWRIEFVASPEFLTAHRPMSAWWVLIGGLFLCSLFGGFLLVVDSTLGQVEEKVQERTWQLALIVEDLKNARAVADDANRVKSDFIANMSHEIRTPLTAILGFSENLREEVSPEEHDDAIEAIIANGEHLLRLINDILDISKIEAGKLQTEQIEVDVINLVRKTGALIDSKVQEKKIDFCVEFITRIPKIIHTDPTRLQQMLINLLGNAIKFSPEGSMILVTVALSEKDTPVGPEPALDFCVFDSGIGMSKKQLAQLFQPFTQGDQSTARRFGGTGLGLTITRQLCEILSGEIVVTSEEGRGTAFRITIPTGPIDGVECIDPDLHPLISSKNSNQAKSQPKSEAILRAERLDSRILLAEDGLDNQKLLRFILERAGAVVEIAEHGGIALTMVREAEERGEPYDLLLTDMQMPEVDGFELVTRLRESGNEMPIIALTASAMAGDRDRCLEIGCDDYASKPIERLKLIEAIRAQLVKTRA